MSIFDRACCFVLLALCATVAGQEAWSIGSDVFARLVWPSSLIIGDYLYIDGGYYDTYTNGVYSSINILNETLTINLSRSWNISDIVINSFSKPGWYFGTRSQAFWWDSSSQTALAYGGEYFQPLPDIPIFYLWELQPDNAGGGTWTERNSSNNGSWGQKYPGAYASIAQSGTTGYALGGFNDLAAGVYPFIPGMMEYNFESESWTNATTEGRYYDGLVAHGAAHYVPGVGAEGLVLFIGGSNEISGAEQVAPSSNITIYDPATGNWYSQQATGTPAPISRLDLCLVGVQESGAGSYEIYMWGGRQGGITDYSDNVDDANEVFILTLPAFNWIRSDTQAGSYRASPTCQVVGNQLISVGGYDPSQTNTPDPWRYSIGVFDMTNLEWKSSFDHKPDPYTRPDLVNRYYETNPAYPSWGSNAIQAAFSSLDGSPAPVQNASSSSIVPSASPTRTGAAGSSQAQAPGKSSGGSSTNVGAIVGGVVGGVALAILVVASIFVLRRQRHRHRPLLTSDETKRENQEMEAAVTPVPQSGLWEMGGQYDRAEVGAESSPLHELDT